MFSFFLECYSEIGAFADILFLFFYSLFSIFFSASRLFLKPLCLSPLVSFFFLSTHSKPTFLFFSLCVYVFEKVLEATKWVYDMMEEETRLCEEWEKWYDNDTTS